MKFPDWCSAKAFVAGVLVTAIALIDAAAKTGFSTEGVVQWIAGSGFGGMFWGAIFTWVGKRVGKQP